MSADSAAQIQTEGIQSVWRELRTAALLGVERHPCPEPGLDGKLGELFKRCAGAPDGETVLLRYLTVLALHRHAARLPEVVEVHLPTPAVEDTRESSSMGAGKRLLTLLNGEPEPLVTEWLELCDQAQKRVTPAVLPALLAYGANRPTMIPLIMHVLGARGRWLAGQNPDWSYAATVDPDLLWQTGKGAERRRLLTEIRHTDPARARQLLESTWKEESAQDRATFLATFADRLGADDEPSLEEALDDRSKRVRRQAADLLARLPRSRFVQRMLARATELLELERGRRFLTSPRLHLSLPESLDESMARDGVDHFPRDAGGPRSAWAMAILSAVPPTFWSERWSLTAAQLIAAAKRSDDLELVLEAWTLASVDQRDQEWAHALLGADIRSQELLSILPQGERESYLSQVIQRREVGAILELLPNLPGWWSAAFSQDLLRRLPEIHEAALKAGGSAWRLRAILEPLGYRLDPSIAEEAAQLLSKTESELTPLLTKVVDTLIVRAQMRKEICE